MKLKKLILILIITIAIMVGVLFGVSYGWYAYSNAESNVIASTVNVTPSVIFDQTEYITSTQNMPIKDEDRYNYANKNSFTITFGNELKEYQIGLEISLKDINMSDELKIVNYKYELLQNNKTVSHGNFSTVGNETTLKLIPMTIVTPSSFPNTYTYDLLIWLSDDGNNQNDLMNKKFNAKVNVISAIKK